MCWRGIAIFGMSEELCGSGRTSRTYRSEAVALARLAGLVGPSDLCIWRRIRSEGTGASTDDYIYYSYLICTGLNIEFRTVFLG